MASVVNKRLNHGQSLSIPHSLLKLKFYTVDHPYQAIDGQVGAWTEDRESFVTSPNTYRIYKPLFGSREVYLRQDYHLGPEDPLLYPQPFVRERCHLAAIPRRPASPDDRLSKWWNPLSPEAFINEPDTIIKGLGRWAKDCLVPYETDCSQLHERVAKYRASRESSSSKPNGLVTALDKHLECTLRHLKGMPLPFHRARQLWSFFQRWYLELVAALDWVEIYSPIMDGRRDSTVLSKAKAALTMGAFLTSVKDSEFFFSAGLPFWLVRSSEHHPVVRVDLEVNLTTPESLNICMDPIMSHKKEVIYTGTLRDVQKAVAIEKFGMAIVDYSSDPFRVPPPPDPTPSSSSIPGPTRAKPIHHRHEPYPKGKGKPKAKAQPQVERDKFSEIRGPFSPEIPEVWVEALASIDKSRRPSRAEVPNGGYAFPDPGMILFCPQEKRQLYLRNWLQLRPILTFRISMDPCSASGAWSPKQWRLLLGTTDDHKAKEGSQMAERRAAIQQLLGQCIDYYGLTIEKPDPYRFTWRDIRYPIGMLSDAHKVQEITWELFELNFRMEFHSLDRLLTSTNPTDPFNPAVQACFGKMKGISNPTEIFVEYANCGPAAAEAKHRFGYFRQMCRVMKQWPGGSHADTFLVGNDKFTDFSEAEVTAMERWVTKFYCQTFFEKFGRPPILPHRVNARRD
ncbi:hypothetical protein V5O48_002824 [Marasmius crinis-equi]|uniref:Uncharacterized protein n=1 Tax=Marasmius crinis-equi TaxID=585013 RepID=A0ABR3FVF2_9AGAR